jgi:hypothetical protein
MRTVLAIDPGGSGGLAWIDAWGTAVARKLDGMTEADIAAYLRDLRTISESTPLFAYIEQVGANRGKGDRRQGASSMFTFGQSYGFLRGCLIALQIPFEQVRPQVWLPAMGLRGAKDETQTQKKNRHKAKAQQMFPQLKPTHATADALLLAAYGRRQLTTPAHDEE